MSELETFRLFVGSILIFGIWMLIWGFATLIAKIRHSKLINWFLTIGLVSALIYLIVAKNLITIAFGGQLPTDIKVFWDQASFMLLIIFVGLGGAGLALKIRDRRQRLAKLLLAISAVVILSSLLVLTLLILTAP